MMILHPATTITTILLATLVTSVRWVKKLNPNFFLVEHEREVTEVEEGDGCNPGFFCMFFEDGDAKDDLIFGDDKPETFVENDSEKSFEDLSNFQAAMEPNDRLHYTEQDDKTASKLLHLINFVREANAEDKKSRKGKNIDLFALLPDHQNTVQAGQKNEKKMPEHMRKFFLPAKVIVPKQYQKEGKAMSDPYAPMVDFDDTVERDLDFGDTGCYTHTVVLKNECWV